MTRAERIERIAQMMYESDPEGEYQQADVQWRYNFADQERYRILADNALAAMETEDNIARDRGDMQAFLDDMNTSVHLMQMESATTILSKLSREDLVDYLHRVIGRMQEHEDEGSATDLIDAQVVVLPTGDSVQAFMIRVEVF